MIYLDNAATTQPLKEVVEEMTMVLTQHYGNPSSVNQLGRKAKAIVEASRCVIAQSIGAQSRQVVFTSGATESNNTAIFALLQQTQKRHIITSSIEHPSVFEVMKQLEIQGYRVTYLPVNDEGVVSVNDVMQAICEDTALISVMFVNNETGAIQPVEAIGQLARQYAIPFHVDAVQAYGQIAIDVNVLGITMLSLSAHKVHGPKGIGALYVSDISFDALMRGGSQENKKRAGTENVANIAGFAKAVSLMAIDTQQDHYTMLQNTLLGELQKRRVNFVVNGSIDKKIGKIINIWLPHVVSSKLLMQLDLVGIFVSAGSACSAGSLQPSRILQCQYPSYDKRASESIRLSFSQFTTQQDIVALVEKIAQFSV